MASRPLARALGAALLAAPGAALAQGAATAAGTSALPPVRPLGAVTHATTEPLASLAAVRQLPGGRVLVNDAGNRRVLLFDSTLATFTVVADSTSATGNAYSGRTGGLIPFRGDSSLFVDPQALSMMVIDPAGKLGRVLSVPRPNDAMALTGVAYGTPGFDARGRLVYRTAALPDFRRVVSAGDGPPQPPVFPDSTPLLRVDLATRAVDTVTFLKSAPIRMSMTQDAEGRRTMASIVNPLPVVDDWAMLPDGTIAVLRGRDFQVELHGPDGSVTRAPKVAHDWQRLTDEDKVAFLDSTRTAMERAREQMRAAGGAGAGGMRVTGPAMPGEGGGAPMMVISLRDGPPPRGERGGAGDGPPGDVRLPPLQFVAASDLPDYKPPFAAGAARADADGNVWVRTIPTKPMPGPVYSVLDRTGRLVDRVVIPAGTAIAGFGPGGVVYLGSRDGTRVTLQRARVR